MACTIFNQSFLLESESGNFVFTGTGSAANPVQPRIGVYIPTSRYSPIYVKDIKSGRRAKCILTNSTYSIYKQERVSSANFGTMRIRWLCTFDIPAELKDKVTDDPRQSYGDYQSDNVSLSFYDSSGSNRYYSSFSMFPLLKRIVMKRYDKYGSFIDEYYRWLMIHSWDNSQHQPTNTPFAEASVSYTFRNNTGYFNYRIELGGVEFNTISNGIFPGEINQE